jgi:dihydropyrimidinase
MYDLVVSGGTAVTPFSTELVDIAVRGEEIVAIEASGSFEGQATKVIDATGCLVLPGGIDPHCHYGVDFQGICTTEGQDFSPAAAYGGTTTIIDFVMQEPPSTLHDAIDEKKAHRKA